MLSLSVSIQASSQGTFGYKNEHIPNLGFQSCQKGIDSFTLTWMRSCVGASRGPSASGTRSPGSAAEAEGCRATAAASAPCRWPWVPDQG